MSTAAPSRRIAGLYLLIGCSLLAIVGWRIAVWTRSGWSGAGFAGAQRGPAVTYAFWTRYKPGTVVRLAAGSPASRQGLTKRDSIEFVNGISTAAPEIEKAFVRARAGDVLRYGVRGKGERTIRLESPLRNSVVLTNLVITLLLALCYLVAGGLVLSKKSGDRRAFVFGVMAVAGALSLFIESVMRVDLGTPIGLLTPARELFGGLSKVLGLVQVALLMHFALIFPRLRPAAQDARKWRRMLVVIYAPTAVLGTFRFSIFLGSAWPLWLQIGAGVLQFAALAVFITFPFATCLALSRSYRESGVEEKRQIRWPVWGIVVALSGPAFAGVVHAIVDSITGTPRHEVDTPLDVMSALFLVLIPISFAIAISKYRLMQIDRLVQKTTVYAMLTLMLVALYFVLAGGIGAVIVRTTNIRNEWVIIASTLAVASILFPVRARVQAVVERRIFPKRYDYPEALARLREVCRSVAETRALLHAAAEIVQQATDSRFLALLWHDVAGSQLVPAAAIGLPDEVIGRLRVDADRFRSLRAPSAATGAIEGVDTAAVTPVRREAKLVGLIVAGRRVDGEEYEPEDLQFFSSAADEVSLGVSRIEMHRDAGEFDEARTIQSGLVPKTFPLVDGFEISGAWEPARVVGGDYFDVLSLPDSSLALCIADVVGKGIPAALLMSNLQATVRAFASPSPADLCRRLHSLIRSNVALGRFVTFFYATLDPGQRRLRYCNAGHNPPILMRAGGSEEQLVGGGPALGAFAAANYEERSVTLAAGDRLVMFTDGVTEAGAEDEQFGEKRLVDFIRDHRQLGARSLQQILIDAVKDFSRNVLQDDLTLLVVAAH